MWEGKGTALAADREEGKGREEAERTEWEKRHIKRQSNRHILTERRCIKN